MKTYELKLTRAMVIAGGVVRAGTKVNLDVATAKDFLRRGKAELVGGARIEDAADDARTENEVDISKLNKPQLVELAQQLGLVSVSMDMTKPEILAAIEAAGQAE